MDALTVGLDVSPLVQTSAGTARHVSALAAALEAEDGVRLRRYSFGGPGRATAAVRDVAWYLAALPAAARRDRVDVLHCPTFRAPVHAPVPLVVTVHDLAVLRHPYVFNRWSRLYGERTLPRVAAAASAIVAVSAFTAGEVVELLGVPRERVHVIPNGVGPPFTADGPRAEGEYVLAVATLEPRKNFHRVVEGFRLAGLSGCELRVAGPPGWGGVSLGGPGVRVLGEVSSDELAALYRGARCVAYASLYEGFGLPVVEAMACGAPVVVSTAPALAEVGGDVAVAVDATDPAAIAAGLEEAVERRSELGRRGIERARGYDWGAAARATVEVYRQVAA